MEHSGPNVQSPIRRGREHLVILSGPSGAGKSTVVRRLLETCPIPLRLSVSATTRAPRPGETDGVDYYFLSREQFESKRRSGEFLECKEVFGRGTWYGTLNAEVEAAIEQARWPILEIDVEGAKEVLDKHPGAITIFLHSGSIEELERRLRDRGTENEVSIHRRLEVAQKELEFMKDYRHVVVNQTCEDAVNEICGILVRYQQET